MRVRMLPALLFLASCTANGGTPARLAGGPCKADCLACDLALGCVDCTDDQQCSPSQPRCVRGKCEACATNADCPAHTPACYPDDHSCHAACPATACSDSTPLCHASTGACVGCQSKSDCADPDKPFCDPATAQCVACVSNADCRGSTPLCYVRKGTCVACLTNADCPSTTPICEDDLKCGTGCPSETCGSDAG